MPAEIDLEALKESAEMKLAEQRGLMCKPRTILALIARLESAEAALEALKDARRKDHAVHEQVCRERDEAERKIADALRAFEVDSDCDSETAITMKLALTSSGEGGE